MNTNNQNGRRIALIIGIYLIAKAIFNMILSGSFSIADFALALIEAAALYTGLLYIDYVIAALCLLVVAVHLKTNLSNIGANLIYLIEAAIDVLCVVILLTNKSVKEHFTNKWSQFF